MDRSLIFLLAAIGLVYLAWLSAKRQTARARQQHVEQFERQSCTLEPVEAAAGRGFVVVMGDERRSDESVLDWSHDGLEVIAVERFRGGPDAGGASGFAPGSNVELIDGDEGDSDLWVWDATMSCRAGTIPAAWAAEVRRRLDAGEVRECVVLWEDGPATARTGIQLLLVHRDVDVDG